jgi:lipopolysaccharide heptosyltransferase II
MEILLVKLGAFGDVINTFPLAIALKEQLGARIHWLVEPLSFPLVAEHPSVDEVLQFERHRWAGSIAEVLKTLRGQRFDMVLDLQRTLKSGLFCLAADGQRRIGFDRERCKELTWLFPFERIRPQDPSRHMLRQYLEFAEHVGVIDAEIRWDIPVSGKHPFELPGQYLVLNIGATKPANKWTIQRFAELARSVQERFGVSSVLTGGPEDRAMAMEIVRFSDAGVINLAGATTVLELKEVLAGAKAVVSCDTGPMHLAVALGRDVITLFGPADPRRTGPFKGEVIQKQMACVPCNRRVCENPVCMLSITPQDVMERLEALWSA